MMNMVIISYYVKKKKKHGITLPQVIMCFNPVKPVVSHLINEKLPKSFVPSD